MAVGQRRTWSFRLGPDSDARAVVDCRSTDVSSRTVNRITSAIRHVDIDGAPVEAAPAAATNQPVLSQHPQTPTPFVQRGR